MNRKIRTSNGRLIVVASLLCLVFVTTYFTSKMYAKYISSSSSSDSASVASFVIETDLNRVELGTLAPPTLELGGIEETESVQLPFYISSESEVKVGYSVIVDFGYALPEYLNITLTNGTDSQTLTADGVKSKFEFMDFGTLLPGGAEVQNADLILTFWVSDLSMITDEVSIPAAAVTVRAYQVD